MRPRKAAEIVRSRGGARKKEKEKTSARSIRDSRGGSGPFAHGKRRASSRFHRWHGWEWMPHAIALACVANKAREAGRRGCLFLRERRKPSERPRDETRRRSPSSSRHLALSNRRLFSRACAPSIAHFLAREWLWHRGLSARGCKWSRGKARSGARGGSFVPPQKQGL